MPQPAKYRSNAERQAAYRRRLHQNHDALQAAKGLPPLPAIATIPGWIRWRQVLGDAARALQEVHDQMQCYYDDRSEQWQQSEKADEFTERMNALEELTDLIDQCRNQFG